MARPLSGLLSRARSTVAASPTTGVRAGHRLDERALAAHLAAHLPEDFGLFRSAAAEQGESRLCCEKKRTVSSPDRQDGA